MMAMHMRWASAIAAVGIVMLVAPASATTFSAFAPCGDQIANSTSPASVSDNCPTGFGGTINGSADSSQGHLGASLNIFLSPGVDSNAQFRTDVVFTPTAGSILTTITIALNLDAAGGSTHSGYSYHMDWSLAGQIGPVFNFVISSAIEGSLGGEGDVTSHTQSNIGFTSGGETLIGGSDTIAGRLTTSLVDVPVNSPVTIALALNLGGFGSGGATGDFLHSFDFPLSDIFTLPDGFTANDADMFIVNNDFRAPAALIPVPSTFSLFASGLCGLGLLGWRRKRKVQAVA